MSSPLTLTGGNFSDAEGNPLALGYLIFVLSQDSSVSGINVCAGVEIKVPLNSSGSADGTVAIWGNDALSPVNSYYRVTGYTAEGQPAWGPNNQQVTGSGSFDLGTWTPNTLVSWVPPTTLVLQKATVANWGTSGLEGQIGYATNGRKSGEGMGSGTGVPIYFSNGLWRVYSTDAQVQA